MAGYSLGPPPLPQTLCILLAMAAGLNATCWAQTTTPRPQPGQEKKAWYTYWNGPRRATQVDPAAFDPAINLPPDPSQFVWQISPHQANASQRAPQNPSQPAQAAVPIYRYDAYEKRFHAIGQKPLGLTVVVDALQAHDHIHYYLVHEDSGSASPSPGANAKASNAYWIAGYYLKASLRPEQASTPRQP